MFIWSKSRILPVRLTEFSITEEAFDTALNPIRAKISLGMRVLSVNDLGFDHKGGNLFMAYLQEKEQLATTSSAGTLSTLGLWRHSLTDQAAAVAAAGNAAHPVSAHQPLCYDWNCDIHRARWPHDVFLRRRFLPPPDRFALLQETR